MRGKNAADDADTPPGEDEQGEPSEQGPPKGSNSASKG